MILLQPARIAAAGLAALLLAAALLPGIAQTNPRDRVQGAVEAVESSCAADITRFCGSATRGEGRLLLCMQAFDDQLSRRCQFVLYRASRHLERSLDRVERLADACWTEIETNCANADRIGQCLVEKTQSLSPSCRLVLDGVRQTLENLPAIRGLPVVSSDNEAVGRVTEVVRDGNGKVQSLAVDIGRFLGVGGRTISIDANSFEQLTDKIKLRLTSERVRSAPDAAKP
jgi:sporulation protein YlmC with PRC-barrel domain